MITEKKLIENNYEIENVEIINADLKVDSYNSLVLNLKVKGRACDFIYGGIKLGFCCFDLKEFVGDAKGEEAIMKIMSVIGVNSLNQLKGKYARIAYKKEAGAICKTIGHIIQDEWFDYEEHFKNEN